ncbi:outer membrane protein OmpA-like peptidoglycan-associated protein/DNA-binding SARP family transcriptional activator [Nocardiopsis mwathae]|uniref:Outer membrane protein OmpA-like peptidoglycan-associated protein/DNA-binding SARP family transcriptional activator n=1 Tax=Nocardiopsis mwathae TaxID=1472723 RepID=A0A7W9YMU8_9ACTN|nr:OmpA family protein [Nocardiopsis mwathae]MBB6174952.1 outer membrane protein OmpA-like peptidoglycan-associated protein/DNA-binding SARP family transcriptional activator [Nocardiopsis mwathae]
MVRGIRQLSALVVTFALLVGLPYAAIVLLAWPELDLSYVSVMAHLRGGSLPPGLGTALLIIALWTVWGLYLLALLVEVAGRLRGRPLAWRLGPLQIVAATAIGATLSTSTAHAAPSESAVVAEASAAETPVPQEPTAEDSGEPAVGESVQGLVERKRVVDGFAYDSDRLSEEMQDDLTPVVDMISTHGAATAPIVITGHTDASGDPDYNRELSQRRAEAVAQVLRTQLGDGGPAVEARGVGTDRLLDDVPDAAQRRVEIAYTVTTRPAAEAPEPESRAPDSEQGGAAANEREDGAVVVLELPSGLLLVSTAAGGVAAGFAFGRRRRTASPTSGRAQPAEVPEEVADDVPAATAEPPTPGTAAGPALRMDTRSVVDLGRGIGITGAGTHDAARSLLSAALQPMGGTPSLRLIVPVEDLNLLLGGEGADLLAERAAPAVTVAESVEDAITLMHADFLARHPDDDILAPSGDETEERSQMPLLLLATPDSGRTSEIETLLRQDSDMTAVLLGPWPAGSCTISREHTVVATSRDLDYLQGAHWPGTGQDSVLRMIAALPPRTPDRPRDDGVDVPRGSSASAAAPRPYQPPAAGEVSPQADEGLPPVAVQVLGRVSIVVRGEPLTLRRHTAFEVTAYLAVHPEGVMLERAIDDMWPGENTARATRRFHDASSALRTSLRDALGDADAHVILHENARYRLNPQLVGLDLWELETALSEVENSAQPAAQHVLRRIASYEDFAAEGAYAWAEEYRLRLRRRVIDAVLHCCASSGYGTARTLLTRAVDIDPYNDDVHHALIRLHFDQGDTHAAIKAYREYESALRTIEADPADEIRALIEDVSKSTK